MTNEVNTRNRVKRSDNTTGVTGVSKISNKTKSGLNQYFVANWIDLSKKRQAKLFSVNKLGYEQAFKMACEYRDKMIEELNKQGAGYTERHGI